MRTIACTTLLAAALVAVCGLQATANPPSWSSFADAEFSDIYLSPSPTTGITDYLLSLGSQPTITISSITYDVNWVQAYFLVSQDKTTPIQATNGTVVTDWTWEYKSTPGSIAGWTGTGPERLYSDESKALGYGSLNIDDNNVLSGMHVGFQNGDSECTGWFKGDLSTVPEPSSLICFGTALIALLPFLRRKNHQN